MWAATVDLRDAYLHILVHKDHRRFLTFRYAEQDYQFRALPSACPRPQSLHENSGSGSLLPQKERGHPVRVPRRLVGGRELSVRGRRQRTQNAPYPPRAGLDREREEVRLSPTQTTQFLGAILDFSAGVARPSEERITAVRTTTQQILSHQESPKMMWLRALGLMASLVDVVRLCRLHMRPYSFTS
ncbi:hypothetical protein BSL78_18631 [Apostichopus japonicus]|uniref:Reverse transcriptase domain-containing protein n=1 Tax=Stichopus japonicus TaxID=307972 RepID=A0A2G8K947_STIJA|nr:hypothetical protein BSL78_18631 [Apostichopus japonicus]